MDTIKMRPLSHPSICNMIDSLSNKLRYEACIRGLEIKLFVNKNMYMYLITHCLSINWTKGPIFFILNIKWAGTFKRKDG